MFQRLKQGLRAACASLLSAASLVLSTPTAEALVQSPMQPTVAALPAAPDQASPLTADLDASSDLLLIDDTGAIYLAVYVGRNPHNGADVYVISPTGLRDLLATMTEIQLTTKDNPPWTEEEVALIQRLFKRYQETKNAVWADYQCRSGMGRFMSHLLNMHNNIDLGAEMLLVHSLRQGEYATSVPRGQQALLILDAGTREMMFGALMRMAATIPAMFNQGVKGTLTQSSTMVAGSGETCPVTGNMIVSSQGTVAQQTQAIIHEGIHSSLTPAQGSLFQTMRANLRIKLYLSSHLLRYAEESIAETAAQLGTRELTGFTVRQALSTGLRFPLHYGYGLRSSQILLEGAVGGAGLYGIYEGVDYVGSQLFADEDKLIAPETELLLLKLEIEARSSQ